MEKSNQIDGKSTRSNANLPYFYFLLFIVIIKKKNELVKSWYRIFIEKSENKEN